MNREFIKLVIMLGAMAIGALALLGCYSGKVHYYGDWPKADAHVADIGQKVTDAAMKVSGSAGEIVTAARDGRNATPEPVRPTLDPFWIKIVANGQLMLAQGDALKAIHQDIDTLRGEVQAGQKQLKEAMTALESEKSGRAQDNKEWEKKLAAANSQWERMFRTIAWLAIVAIGISVTVGVLMHDFRVSIAGGAGGMAVVVACMIVGQIQHWLPWVAGGLLVAVALWVLIETILRGSLQAAIRTTPLQDIRDAISGVAPAAAPATAPATGG